MRIYGPSEGGARRRIKVLVVDDSALARHTIVNMLNQDPGIRVVGMASDGQEALDKAAMLDVQVVTLDLQMPGLDGLATLRRLRAAHEGLQVVVVSELAAANAEATLQALDLGAFDVVAKPRGPAELPRVAQELIAKVRGAAGLDGAAGLPAAPSGPAALPQPGSLSGLELLIIGTSTGGPRALQAVLPRLPAGFPVPVVVLQHMPPGYTRALAEQLARQCALPVLEARHEDALTPGRVLIAPSGHQLAIRKAAHGPARVAIAEAAPYPTFYRPCVDYGFEEAARVYGKGALGVVMTGMGADGARGARAIREAGGACWAQDQATSTIFGMPRAAAEAGAVSWVFPLELLAEGLRVAIGR